MRRTITVLFATTIGIACCIPALCQQTSVNSVYVYTEPPGMRFLVDGQAFNGAGNFLWPAASKHTIRDDPSPQAIKMKVGFKGMVTNLDAEAVTLQPITADPGLKWIKLQFDVFYALTMYLAPCAPNAQGCPTPGRLEIVGVGVFDRDSEVFLEAGRLVTARAYPNNGFTFTGWGALSGFATAFTVSFTLDGPRVLQPQFVAAAPVQVGVNLQTDPPGLQVFADRTPYNAPVKLEWGDGTRHSIGAPETQSQGSELYVFASWSDGGAINHDVLVSQQNPINFVASYVRAGSVTFRTSPPALKLSIDGTQSWHDYSFGWLPGSTHAVSAPLTQTDSAGHKYEFVSWSSGKPASFTYTAPGSGSIEIVTANYRAIGQISIASDPSGLSILVDERPCVTPCVIERPAGTAVQLSAPDVLDTGSGSRLLFSRWSDGASASRSVETGLDKITYTAQFRRQFQLSLSPDPIDGAVIQVNPVSAGHYYDAATVVAVNVSLRPGFRVVNWSGDLSGKSLTASLSLDSPRSAVLQLERVPAIIAPGMRCAAPSPSGSRVAPGSLISIYGVHLAPETLVGPVNPLAQTLAGVTVRVDGVFLPLLFVSPQQINAQLASGLEPGIHKLFVGVDRQLETSTDIEVVRNAPGLFAVGNDDPLGLFIHEGGEPVTSDRPAHAGEVISMLGTGLGGYRQPGPDGFVIGESDAYAVVDTLELFADGMRIDPLYAGRTNAGVGIDAVRFAVPASSGPSSFVQVKIVVNGVESNVVSLPVSR